MAVAVATLLAAACGRSTETAAVEPAGAAPAPTQGEEAGPVVEVAPAGVVLPPLDPNADPRTPLGELRARYLPIWSPDFDWAFPPEVCGSDWALDAIAEPTSGADPAVLGDPVVAAALSVMRFEYLVSRALAEPHVLGQLCVAVATVGATRTEALDLLAEHLGTGTRAAGTPTYPQKVTIVAASPAAVLAVACVVPEFPENASHRAGVAGEASAVASLQAYLLGASHGMEDAVRDVSLRVASVMNRPADSCAELESWAAEWAMRAEEWAAAGELWGQVGQTVSANEICGSRPAGRRGDCPREWER